ncbi:glycerol kinase GlpK, partial [Dysosmobacter welbionis]
QGGVQLFPADAAGRHLEAQGALPGVYQRLGHGGAVPLVHVEIFQLPQVPGVGVSGLRQQAAGLLRQLVPVRGVVVQQHAAICTEILLPAPRHAGRDQALSGIRRGARRLSSGRTVRRQSQRPTDPGIHQRILRAVEHHRLNAQLPRQGPALRLDQGRQLLRREDAQEIHLPGVVEVLSRLCGLRKSERQGLRPGETVAVGLAGLQGQRLTSLIPAHLIRPVGHKARKVVPPRGRLRRLRRCFGGLPVSGSGLLLQQVLPQRHGGGRSADLRQKPVELSVQHHHQGAVILRRHLQQRHVAGLPHGVVACYHGQQRRAGGIVGRIGQPLPGKDKVPGPDRPAVGPLGLPQLEGPGHGAVGILLRTDALGCAVRHRGPAGAVSCFPHQIFIQVDQDGLVRRLCGVDGIQLLRRAAHADGEGRPLPASAAAGQAESQQRRRQEQRPPALPILHIVVPPALESKTGTPAGHPCISKGLVYYKDYQAACKVTSPQKVTNNYKIKNLFTNH